MFRLKEVALGLLLIIFVLGTAVASLLWAEPAVLLPQDDSRPHLALPDPVAQPAPQLPTPRTWRSVFPIVYAGLTVALLMVAGLVCAANCWRQLMPFDKMFNRLHKTNRTNFT